MGPGLGPGVGTGGKFDAILSLRAVFNAVVDRFEAAMAKRPVATLCDVVEKIKRFSGQENVEAPTSPKTEKVSSNKVDKQSKSRSSTVRGVASENALRSRT